MSLPHVHCCLKQSLIKRLADVEHLTVGCNRADCWNKAENYPGRAAINIAIGRDRPGERTSIPDPEFQKTLNSPELCIYRNTLSVTVEIYVVNCDDTFCVAKSAESQILPLLMPKLPCTVETLYTGSTPINEMEKTSDFTLLTIDLEIEYFFAPDKPWLLIG